LAELTITFGAENKQVGSVVLGRLSRRLEDNLHDGLMAAALLLEGEMASRQGRRPYPMIRSHTFMNSITHNFPDKLTVLVGPGGLAKDYAMALEYGHPKWPRGVKYPTVKPTWKDKGDDAIDKVQAKIMKGV